MSKTYRKRAESYVAWYGDYYTVWDTKNKRRKNPEHYYTDWRYAKPEDNEWESYEKEEVLYHTDNYGQGYFRRKLPKHYRKMINRQRRLRNKRELWKEVHNDGYEGLYSNFNCKDSQHWYW